MTELPWEAIGELARLAPTPHNTQPYRIRPRSDRDAELVLVCDRLLPAEDPGNTYVLSAFGVFAATLERAARATGHAATIVPCEALDGPTLTRASGTRVVGTVTLEPAPPEPTEAALLVLRRTSRLPYHARRVPDATLHHFAAIARAAGHELAVRSGRDDVACVLRHNALAIIDNLQDDAEREEIRGWHRLGATPAHGDGLWQVPMNQPAWQLRAAFRAPWLLALEPIKSLAIARYLTTQRGTQHVAVLGGPFVAWPELVAAGRMLFRLWLAMADANVYMHPFGSMLTNPHHAAWVERELGVPRPWLLLRLGYSDPPPAAPRLASIVMS